MGKIINGQRLFLIVMSAVFVCLTSSSLQAAGSWKSLTHSCPETPTSSLLLTNGQVLTVTGSGDCYLLTPDQHGHYWDGMWNQSASMLSQPTTINGAVLNSGKVLLVAGEFSAQTNLVQVYDPVQNTWAFTSETYTDSTGQHPLPGFEDCNVDLLNNGHVITTPDDSQVPITLEYDPNRNSWTRIGDPLQWQDETSWLKLPDSSILTVDINDTTDANGNYVPYSGTSERFMPATGTWISDANLPFALFGGGETGATCMLPNGLGFFLGGAGHTGLYKPSGSEKPGTWVQGPDLPILTIQGQQFQQLAGDVPLAMLNNGKVLCVTTSKIYGPGVTFLEYDPSMGPYNSTLGTTIGSFTQVALPPNWTPNGNNGLSTMLNLPDGTILCNTLSDTLPAQSIYVPGGSPLTTGRPTVVSLSAYNPTSGDYNLQGTLLTGISQGADYGDDF